MTLCQSARNCHCASVCAGSVRQLSRESRIAQMEKRNTAMLRTALTATLATLGLAAASPAADVKFFAQIGPSYRPTTVVEYGHRESYQVQVRRCREEPWQTYAVTRSHE